MENPRGPKSYAGVAGNSRGSARRGGRNPPTLAGPQAQYARARRVFNRAPRVTPPPPPLNVAAPSFPFSGQNQQQRLNRSNICGCGRAGVIWCVDCSRMFCNDPCPAYYMICRKPYPFPGINHAAPFTAGAFSAAQNVRPPPAHQYAVTEPPRMDYGHNFVRCAVGGDLGMQNLSLASNDNESSIGDEWVYEDGAGESLASRRSSDSDSSGSSLVTVISVPGYGSGEACASETSDDNNNGAKAKAAGHVEPSRPSPYLY